MCKQLKKKLKEQIDQINKKMQFELEFFRQEMKPLKTEKTDRLHECRFRNIGRFHEFIFTESFLLF